jgi:hypothetical protein
MINGTTTRGDFNSQRDILARRTATKHPALTTPTTTNPGSARPHTATSPARHRQPHQHHRPPSPKPDRWIEAKTAPPNDSTRNRASGV